MIDAYVVILYTHHMTKTYNPGYARLRAWIGRLLGFEQEIEELQKRIRELQWDTAFDMWTRTALLQICRMMPRGKRAVAFFDFDDIHGLNHKVGYVEVDRRIRQTFSIQFRTSDLVARWYSGDEIVIVFDADESGAREKIAELKQQADLENVGFMFQLGTWDVGNEGLVDVVNELSEKNRLEQSKRNEELHGNRSR